MLIFSLSVRLKSTGRTVYFIAAHDVADVLTRILFTRLCETHNAKTTYQDSVRKIEEKFQQLRADAPAATVKRLDTMERSRMKAARDKCKAYLVDLSRLYRTRKAEPFEYTKRRHLFWAEKLLEAQKRVAPTEQTGPKTFEGGNCSQDELRTDLLKRLELEEASTEWVELALPWLDRIDDIEIDADFDISDDEW